MASFGVGYSRLASTAFLNAERACARATSYFVAVGQEIASAYIAAGIGRPEQYVVIRSPIDVRAFASARFQGSADRDAARRSFALPTSSRLILGCGLLEPRKRWSFVIRELAPLLRKGEATLALAGAGQEEAELKRLVADLGLGSAVRLLGYVHDLPRLFVSADLLVHASTSEGVPQVVIQAAAAGVPVVATEVTGLREVPGASVSIVPSGGGALLRECRCLLVRPRPEPVPLTALEKWSPAAVAAALSDFHRRLENSLRADGILTKRLPAVPTGS
jgi:glycosyltransferase involved in cell wall biosynthesis